jgi:hypothetical protein
MARATATGSARCLERSVSSRRKSGQGAADISETEGYYPKARNGRRPTRDPNERFWNSRTWHTDPESPHLVSRRPSLSN